MVNNNVKGFNRCNINKKFQWHKLYLFNSYFKQWKYIFYIDCGMNIYKEIQPLIDCKKENILLAHSDAYPSYKWKLSRQLDETNNEYFEIKNDWFKNTSG